MNKTNPNSHTHCQVTQGNHTIQNLSRSMSAQRTVVNERNYPERKTRKPNKMYSECAFEPFSTSSAIRYFSDIGKCERTHHT